MRTFTLKWNTLHNEITDIEEFFVPIERSVGIEDQQQKMKRKIHRKRVLCSKKVHFQCNEYAELCSSLFLPFIMEQIRWNIDFKWKRIVKLKECYVCRMDFFSSFGSTLALYYENFRFYLRFCSPAPHFLSHFNSREFITVDLSWFSQSCGWINYSH